MNKLTKNFLLVTILFSSIGLKAANAVDDGCLFTPNPAFCIEDSISFTQESTDDVEQNLVEVAALLVDEVIAEMTSEIVAIRNAQQVALATLKTALETLQDDIKRRRTEIEESAQDIFKKEIYDSLNFATNNIILALPHKVLTILVTQEKVSDIATLLKDYHTKSIALEKSFTKSHRTQNQKDAIREILSTLQTLEASIESIKNDEIKTFKDQGGVFKRM